MAKLPYAPISNKRPFRLIKGVSSIRDLIDGDYGNFYPGEGYDNIAPDCLTPTPAGLSIWQAAQPPILRLLPSRCIAMLSVLALIVSATVLVLLELEQIPEPATGLMQPQQPED